MFQFKNDKLNKIINEKVIIKKIPKSTHIVFEGDYCHDFPIIKSGKVRIYKIGESGKEITLYRLEKGEGCILTFQCILKNVPFPAFTIVEEDAEIYLLSKIDFKKLFDEYQEFRDFVLSTIFKRIDQMIITIEEIAFKRMDLRIFKYLLKNKDDQNFVNKTHQEIASDLGTAREVVSRILKDFEQENLIKNMRGKIKILDLEKLKQKWNSYE